MVLSVCDQCPFSLLTSAGCVFVCTGACEGTLACSTCHLIFKPADYEKLPETPTDEELDMLDLAYGLQDTYVLSFSARVPPPHCWPAAARVGADRLDFMGRLRSKSINIRSVP